MYSEPKMKALQKLVGDCDDALSDLVYAATDFLSVAEDTNDRNYDDYVTAYNITRNAAREIIDQRMKNDHPKFTARTAEDMKPITDIDEDISGFLGVFSPNYTDTRIAATTHSGMNEWPSRDMVNRQINTLMSAYTLAEKSEIGDAANKLLDKYVDKVLYNAEVSRGFLEVTDMAVVGYATLAEKLFLQFASCYIYVASLAMRTGAESTSTVEKQVDEYIKTSELLISSMTEFVNALVDNEHRNSCVDAYRLTHENICAILDAPFATGCFKANDTYSRLSNIRSKFDSIIDRDSVAGGRSTSIETWPGRTAVRLHINVLRGKYVPENSTADGDAAFQLLQRYADNVLYNDSVSSSIRDTEDLELSCYAELAEQIFMVFASFYCYAARVAMDLDFPTGDEVVEAYVAEKRMLKANNAMVVPPDKLVVLIGSDSFCYRVPNATHEKLTEIAKAISSGQSVNIDGWEKLV